MKGRVIGALTVVIVWALAIAGPPASAAPAPSKTAPGSESYFDLARKDCVGTAANTSSKVWFTVADGVLSDTYWPTVDATNVHTLQYLVTDGHTFTDLQTRNMTYKVLPDFTGMSCTVVATPTPPGHGYSITTTYIADPARDAVLMRTRFDAPPGDQLYVRLDPLAGGTGGGGSQNAGANSAILTSNGVPVAFNTNTTTQASNRDYAVRLPRQHDYTIGSPWSQRLEAQGFAPPVWVDASNGSKGNPQFVVDDKSGTATLILPQAAFGTVGSGWTFTVALTGQDGTHFPPTRDFTATPDQYTFGVCASGGTSPICSLTPSTVPKVMDTIPPAGVENPIPGPVVLQGVTVP